MFSEHLFAVCGLGFIATHPLILWWSAVLPPQVIVTSHYDCHLPPWLPFVTQILATLSATSLWLSYCLSSLNYLIFSLVILIFMCYFFTSLIFLITLIASYPYVDLTVTNLHVRFSIFTIIIWLLDIQSLVTKLDSSHPDCPITLIRQFQPWLFQSLVTLLLKTSTIILISCLSLITFSPRYFLLFTHYFLFSVALSVTQTFACHWDCFSLLQLFYTSWNYLTPSFSPWLISSSLFHSDLKPCILISVLATNRLSTP